MAIGAETYLQPALQPVFDLIFSNGVKLFLKLIYGEFGGELEDTLKEWETELMLINDVLDDAVHKQFQSKAVKRWLEELQDLAFDMEDILQDFVIQAQEHEFKINMNQNDAEDDGQGVLSAVNNMVSSISDTVSTLYNTYISPSIQSKINGINTRLHRIQSRIPLLRLSMTNNTQQQLTLQTEAVRSQRESSSVESETKVFGRDDIKQEIIARLLKDDDPSNDSYVVIPIVGSGGIGKTTLAQCVYNDEQLKGHFHLKAWVCVSDVFDVKRITTTIIKATIDSGTLVEFSTLSEAQTRLKEILTEKKFLIVLDDIWNEVYDDWFRLQTPFKYAAKGSRVIMTTRIQGIARMMINRPVHDTIITLKGLSEDECWHLFQQHANDNSDDVTEMRDNIIKNCKGLPLAAKVLGGLFKKTVDKTQRQRILKSNILKEENGILPVLRLSYDHLSSELKRVFAYCSVFPKDHRLKKKEIILLWMAQGFLPDKEHIMEDLGDQYFSDLESRSLFEKCPYDEGSCIMHDLIHDMALWAAGGICYAMGTKTSGMGRIRHVFHTKDASGQEIQSMASHLRTFYDDGTFTNLDSIQRCSYLRALRLTSKTIKVLPEFIGDLKHLRFLSFKFENLEELPKTINRLWNLQTLVLEGCSGLKKVPDISSLKQLRHMGIGRTRLLEMPQGIEKLTNLRSLDQFILDLDHGFRVREMKKLNYLQGKLTISELGSVTKVEDAKEAQLHKKCGLDELYLHWGYHNDNKREIVEQLKPPTCIKVCELCRYMGLTLPSWLGDPCFNKMVHIILAWCEKCEWLPPLGQLPCLKRLEIRYMSSIKQVGAEFYGDVGCSNPFPALELLYFEGMKCWKKWDHIAGDNNTAFSCLEHLEISECGWLQGDIPPHLPSLKSLEIIECHELSVSLSLASIPLLKQLRVTSCGQLEISTNEDVIQGELAHLTDLSIRRCRGVISLPEDLLLPALQHLEIDHCENMESLRLCEMHKYASLKTLRIENCPKLQCFLGRGLPRNLRIIAIVRVKKIEALQEWGLHRLQSLVHLHISGLLCRDEDVEKDLNLSLPSSYLENISLVNIQNLKNVSVVNSTNLKHLTIKDCRNLESLVGNFTSLHSLSLCSCLKLHSLPPLILTTIIEIELRNLGSCTDAIEQIPGPDLDLDPSFLCIIKIEGFKNLKTISCSNFPLLRNLTIECCPKFESFGNTTLSPYLEFVTIYDCEMIKPHLQSDPENGVIKMDGHFYSLR